MGALLPDTATRPSLPLLDSDSPDAAILEAFEKVRAHRAWAYSFDPLATTDQAAWIEIAEAFDTMDDEQRAIEDIVGNSPAKTPAGVAAKIVLTTVMECPRWHDRALAEHGILACHRLREGLDGRDQTVIEAAVDLLQIEWAAALADYERSSSDYREILQLKAAVEEEEFRQGRDGEPGQFITALVARVEALENRFCDDRAIKALLRTLAPDWPAYRRKAEIAIKEGASEISAEWLLRDANFIMGGFSGQGPDEQVAA